jgi:hypothetical protein
LPVRPQAAINAQPTKEAPMVENVIFLLIYIALVVLVVYLIQWFLGRMGFSIDPMVMNVIWVIVVLIIILLCWRAFSPFIGGHGFFPR